MEDEPEVKAIISRVLTGQGYHVLEARDGGHALGLAATHPSPIHLLLTDVIMPRMSGRDLADRFAKIRPDARILFVSGYTDDTILHLSVLEAKVQFLQKPFSPSSLAQKVRSVLDAPHVEVLANPGS